MNTDFLIGAAILWPPWALFAVYAIWKHDRKVKQWAEKGLIEIKGHTLKKPINWLFFFSGRKHLEITRLSFVLTMYWYAININAAIILSLALWLDLIPIFIVFMIFFFVGNGILDGVAEWSVSQRSLEKKMKKFDEKKRAEKESENENFFDETIESNNNQVELGD